MQPSSRPSPVPAARLPWRALLLAVLLCSCVSRPGLLSLDDHDDTESFPAAEEPAPPPDALVDLADGADWIQLVSGEWLRGELTRIRDETIDFESDELDELSLDLDDVRTVRTASPQVVVTDDGRILRGWLVLEGDVLWVQGVQLVKLRRRDVLSTLALSGDKTSDWSAELSLGATVRSGNTQQEDYTAFAELKRETVRTIWDTTYNGALSRREDEETANNHRVRSAFDVFLSERAFVTVPSVELYHDRLQNIDYRITPALAAGYQVADTADHEWKISAGPAFQHVRYTESGPGEDSEDSSFAVVARSEYGWDVIDDVELDFDYSLTAPLPDTDEYNHNFLVRLSVDVTDDLSIDVTFVWDRVESPVADANGDVPQRDDYRTTIGLGWSF